MLINKVKYDSILGSNACGVYSRKENGELIDVYPEQSMVWPNDFFAMSHVAVPISPKNEVYGATSRFSQLLVHGERNVLVISADDLMRIQYNPFFELMEMEIKDFIRKSN